MLTTARGARRDTLAPSEPYGGGEVAAAAVGRPAALCNAPTHGRAMSTRAGRVMTMVCRAARRDARGWQRA